IPDPTTAARLGLDLGQVRRIPNGAFDRNGIGTVPADGTLLQELDGGPVYVVYGGARFGLPDPETAAALGLNLGRVGRGPGGSFDRGGIGFVPADGTLLQQQGDPVVYVIQRGQRRGVPSREAADMLGLDWGRIHWVPSGELNALPDG